MARLAVLWCKALNVKCGCQKAPMGFGEPACTGVCEGSCAQFMVHSLFLLLLSWLPPLSLLLTLSKLLYGSFSVPFLVAEVKCYHLLIIIRSHFFRGTQYTVLSLEANIVKSTWTQLRTLEICKYLNPGSCH